MYVCKCTYGLPQPPAPLVQVSDESADRGSTEAGKPLQNKKYKSTLSGSSKAGAKITDTRVQPRTHSLSEEPVLDENKMKAILKGFGEYPEKYRLATQHCGLIFNDMDS